jgi:putative oxidoreductase
MTRLAMRLHDELTKKIEAAGDRWLIGSAARLVFAATLLLYFWNSARTKIGEGFFGFFSVSDNAYYQIALPAVEAAGGDVSQVAFLPWGLMVWAGTYAEFILPFLIVVGLATRIAALGMICFVIVQSAVDIFVHQVGAETTGALFDRFSDGLIADQRLFWVFLFTILVVKGAGALSLDAIILKRTAAPARGAAGSSRIDQIS